MSTIDHLGNVHAGAGAPGGGQFSGRVNTAPAVELPAEDVPPSAAPDWRWEPPTYRIPTANLGSLQERIDHANRRLQRAGIEERFSFTTERRIVRDHRSGQDYLTNDVTLNTPRIAAGDWHFDGVHELGANGRVVSHFTGGAEAVLDPERDLLICEHCGHRRSRTKVVVLSNPTTGETKQVGTNCLELFLGVRPAGLWTLTEDFDAGDLAVDDDDLGSFRCSGLSVMDADDVMAVTMQVVAEDGGYLSKAKAAYDQKPTATKVLEQLEKRAALHPEISAADRAEIDEVLAWVDAITPAEASEYERNLHEVLAADGQGNRLVARKHIGLVASAIATHRNHKTFELRRKLQEEARAERDAKKAQSYLAAPGEKLKGRGIEATVLSVRVGTDYGYGAPLHVSMIDDDGHVIYWKCSGSLGGTFEAEDGTFEQWSPSDGSRVLIAAGTVKDNRVSDYNGDWETVITRAKLVRPDASVAD